MGDIPLAIIAIFLGGAVLALWVLLPLFPAILIYRSFPSNPLVVEGPLAGLTVKTGGAFGAYLLIFLLTAWQLGNVNSLIAGLPNQFWTVKTQIHIADENNKIIKAEELMKQLQLVLDPDVHSIKPYGVKLRLIEERDGLPSTVFRIHGYGDHAVNWKLAKRDERNRTIELEPIIIKPQGSTSSPIAAQPARIESGALDSSAPPDFTGR